VAYFKDKRFEKNRSGYLVTLIKIRTVYTRNTSLELYRCTNMLHEVHSSRTHEVEIKPPNNWFESASHSSFLKQEKSSFSRKKTALIATTSRPSRMKQATLRPKFSKGYHDIIKSSRATSRIKWLNYEKTNVSRTFSVLVLRVLKWLEFPSVSYSYLISWW
jgi:hypothetical protein